MSFQNIVNPAGLDKEKKVIGTRWDLYVGRGLDAEWLGSGGWDGYPSGNPAPLLSITEEAEYREAVSNLLARASGTTPDMGWPWPWEDSQTSDYAYAFENGKVWASCFGHEWFDPLLPELEDEDEDEVWDAEKNRQAKTAVFPNMKAIQNVATDSKRSGIIILGYTTQE